MSAVGTEGAPQGCRLPRAWVWPELPYAGWRDTLETLHRWIQVVGKIRLAQTPFEAEWQNVPLQLTARGLTTGPVPCGDVAFEVAFDFIDHRLVPRRPGAEGVAGPLPRQGHPGGALVGDVRPGDRPVQRSPGPPLRPGAT